MNFFRLFSFCVQEFFPKMWLFFFLGWQLLLPAQWTYSIFQWIDNYVKSKLRVVRNHFYIITIFYKKKKKLKSNPIKNNLDHFRFSYIFFQEWAKFFLIMCHWRLFKLKRISFLIYFLRSKMEGKENYVSLSYQICDWIHNIKNFLFIMREIYLPIWFLDDTYMDC